MRHLLQSVSAFTYLILFPLISINALTPTPIISRGKQVYGSNLNGASNLVNGKFGESAWILANNSWAAIDLQKNYTKVLFIWNCTNYMWSDSIASPNCPQNRGLPRSYEISISSNSTNGVDGEWTKELSIEDNIVANRPHFIEGEAIRWIKMSIVQTSECQIDELEVFDVENGMEDTWLFVGTSITANAFKGAIPEKSFADLVTENNAAFTPAIVRGGIGCIKSFDFARDFPEYFKAASAMHYWAIEMGTNDGFGGYNGRVDTLKTAMQQVIDSCKAHGIVPVLARAMGTNESVAKWQIHPDFVNAIDDLIESNDLIEGPDLYTYFSTHPSDLASDGIHPSASGGQAMQRLWAEKMSKIYNSTSVNQKTPVTQNVHRNHLSVINYSVLPSITGEFEVFTIDGKICTGNALRQIRSGLSRGIYIIQWPEKGN